MDQNDAYVWHISQCLIDDPACEDHYSLQGPGVANIGENIGSEQRANRFDLCWYDSWYDYEQGRLEQPCWKITLTRSIHRSEEEKAISPEDWGSISETRWALFEGAQDEVIQEAIRRYRLVTGIDLNIIELDISDGT